MDINLDFSNDMRNINSNNNNSKMDTINVQKIDNVIDLNLNNLETSPRLVEIPSLGLDLLENKNKKRDTSMDLKGSLDMPLENINISFDNIISPFDALQQKKNMSNVSSLSNQQPRIPTPRANTTFDNPFNTPINLGFDTLNDIKLNLDNASNLSNDININDLNKKINIVGDPYASMSEVKQQPNIKEEKKIEAGNDGLDALNIDDLLSECSTLKEKFGINIPEHFNRKTPIDEIRAFIRRERKKREKSNAEKLGAKILLTIITSLEFLNNKFDPFDLKLDGWSEGIHENIEDYNELFGELYDKYKTDTKLPPEVKLIMMVGGSAAMVHLTNTMFKTSIPGMEEMLKQNPEMMKQFAQSAMNQVSGNNQPAQNTQSSAQTTQSSMNMPFSGANKSAAAPPPPVNTRGPPPSQRPVVGQQAMGPMRPTGPANIIGSGLPAMPRREMKGPTGLGVDDILKELTGNKPPTPKNGSPSGSLISSGGTNRRTLNISLK
jgi:hypothetical protein